LSESGYREAQEAASYIQTCSGMAPKAGLILGSGLGEVANRLDEPVRIAYSAIPHFPQPSIAGHRGTLHLGRWRGVPMAVLEGRLHRYEGYSPAQVVFPTRVLGLAGAGSLIVTCAAGGIHPKAAPGTLMIFSDHLNLQGASPLAGPQEARWGERFVDLTEAYDARLRGAALRAAAGLRIRCFEGVYAAVAGPNYETPAEIRALRRLGADAVGMSTAPEVLAARQLRMQVLAVAAISNRAAGLRRRPLTHTEVLEAGKKASKSLARLLDELMAAPGFRE
jgi:purine-nucleoside phosphorylase